jgi:putative sterol carrier protein
MSAGFNPQAAKGIVLVYQFHLTGEGGGQYHLVLADQACKFQEGEHASPDVVLAISAEDFRSLVMGKLPFAMAFVTGRLKVTGDLRLVLRMGAYFPQPQ